MQPADLFSTISAMRDGIDTLIQRGKPVSPADLQQLIAAVEAKNRPTLDAGPVAQVLAPSLLAALPTPENLRQAGQQAAATIEQAVQQATAQSQAALTAAAAELARTAERIPREVPVRGEVIGFTSLRAAGLLLGFGLVLVLGLVGAVVSRNGARDELAAGQARTAQLERWFTFYTERRQQLVEERPELAYKYFPQTNDPKPPAKGKAARK